MTRSSSKVCSHETLSQHTAAALTKGAMLGAASAVYPARIAISVRPNEVLAGRADTESN
jgi:putative ABC transport system permease protein